ncbi:MAG: hypothetical protein JSU87_11185 [Gemmatimonadota bacterium]|nr:MAG: hypothetical protein JSU87_11185 [Gemmatimonadota bacterium]
MTSRSQASEESARATATAPELLGRQGGKRAAVLVDSVAEAFVTGTNETAPATSTEGVVKALDSLGYETSLLPLEPGKAAAWLSEIGAGEFDVVFNLCESVHGYAAAEHLAAAAVELLGLPLTGARSTTLLHCLDKDRCAAVLQAHGFAVPAWRRVRQSDAPPEDWDRFAAIVKPAAQDASNGVHPNSVVRSRAELVDAIERLRQHWGDLVIQDFIEGREINLAIVGNHLLPPAEIDFSDLPGGTPPIVSFAAKWQPGSPEDAGTRPVCPAPLPAKQAEALQQLAARAWRLMDGNGYARVDIRLDADGVPYVIDINPNPDLSPDAGLARQAKVAGWSYERLIEKIVEEALLTARDGGWKTRDWVTLPPRTNGLRVREPVT